MTIEQTFSMIKPDAVRKNLIGIINARFEAAGLQLVAAKMVHLKRQQAEGFYAEHRDRPFFQELVDFITSGPVMLQVWQGQAAVRRYREIIGATDPKQALAGTVRSDYATSLGENAVHGSDALATAAQEISYFFSEAEIFPRPLHH